MYAGTRSFNTFRFLGLSVQYLGDRDAWEYMPASSQSTVFEFLKGSSQASRSVPLMIDAQRAIDVASMKQCNILTGVERPLRLHLDVHSIAPGESQPWSFECDDGSFAPSDALTYHAIAWSRISKTLSEPMDRVTLFMGGTEYTIDKNWTTQQNATTGRRRAIRAPASAVAPPLAAPIPPVADHDYSEDMCCPITLAPFTDPVVASDGKTYERAALVAWLQRSDKSPLTGIRLPNLAFVADDEMRRALQKVRGD